MEEIEVLEEIEECSKLHKYIYWQNAQKVALRIYIYTIAHIWSKYMQIYAWCKFWSKCYAATNGAQLPDLGPIVWQSILSFFEPLGKPPKTPNAETTLKESIPQQPFFKEQLLVYLYALFHVIIS